MASISPAAQVASGTYNVPHPIESQEVTDLVNNLLSLVEKIRAMKPIPLFCLTEKISGGGDYGVDREVKYYYTDRNVAEKANSYSSPQVSQVTGVLDEGREIFLIDTKPTLHLEPIRVTRHGVEERLYQDAQRLLQAQRSMAEAQRTIRELSHK
jgi:hypothetical protein